MMNRVRAAAFVFTALSLALFGPAPAFAHHGWTGYQNNARATVSGTVTMVDFRNPHTRFTLYVAAPDGTVESWLFEGGSVGRLRRAGWSEDTLKAGDEITVEFNPKRDGSPGGIFRRIVRVDGEVIRGPLNGLLDGLLDSVLDPGPD